jgi:hypothetical protein
MKKTIIVIAAIIATVSGVLIACTGAPKGINAESISKDSLIKRGDYLVTAMGCDDCHTPKKMGPKGPEFDLEHRYAGHLADSKMGKADLSVMKNGWVLFSMLGTATVGPWGMSFAANITSDATGIGNWTEEQFFTAMRKGKYKGLEESRPLLPPMPWQAFAKLNDTDIKAIFAYLKSTKPVNNLVPAAVPLQDLK